MTSLASLKGPSVSLGLPPVLVSENETRAQRSPSTLGGGHRAPRSTPVFCRDSLYFIIAATALASGMVSTG